MNKEAKIKYFCSELFTSLGKQRLKREGLRDPNTDIIEKH